ncbi:glycerophosphodiester phosphodiesterase family protein [Novosphingobium tardum]|jgi:glycerophosphoryl diester phosphodiesterase|uniref:Glycerophosphodiester phosphodiesterase family protein n=1 Tax=Novosphingobium tardum TaxID=1538021 RepID=A0ABV8RLC3_9SPHN
MRLSPFGPLDRWRAPAPSPERVGWLRSATFAHRGLHGVGGEGPIENSPTAFADAIARGLGIECDVQRSADGQAMVFHDWTLERLTAATGPVVEKSAEELGSLRLGKSADTIFTLPQLLDLVGGRVPLLIEIKSRRDVRFAPLCLAVRSALEGYRGPVAVMSFDPRVCAWFARHNAHIVRGLVVTEEGHRGRAGRLRRQLSLWAARPDFLAYDVRDLPSRFAAAQRKRGLPLLTWTVRSPELAARAALHADAPIAEGAGIR